MAKKVNDSKIKRSDVLYYRMLIVLAALIAVIFSITYATRTAEGSNSFIMIGAPITAVVFAVLCVPAVIFYAVCRKKGINERNRVFSSGYLLLLTLWLTSVFALYGPLSSKAAMAYIIVTAALYYIYYIFKKEFFVLSVYASLGAALLLSINSARTVEHIISAILSVLISAAVLWAVARDKKKALTLKIGKGTVGITDGSFKLYPFAVLALVIVLGALLSFFMANVAFYSLVILFAAYLIFTIVNTVKMM
ncbi:MAG: hypothetical protein IKJ91_10530 [Clostridia bacterium]|nr:hypothetical protein [Clostridia bacterium]